MLLMHPIYLAITFVTSMVWYTMLPSKNKFKSILLFGFIFLSTVLINALINTSGETIAFEIFNRIISVEALCYGMAVATMITAVLMWFSNYNLIVGTEKFLFLFGKIVPTFALTFVITLQLIPKFQRKIQQISRAQKAIGMDYTTGAINKRLKVIVRILSILLTWALENSIETADIMKARGYGLANKTSFSLYKFEKKDWLFLFILAFLIVFQIYGLFLGVTNFTYYPQIQSPNVEQNIWIFYGGYSLLCSLPILCEIKGKLRWRTYKSRI